VSTSAIDVGDCASVSVAIEQHFKFSMYELWQEFPDRQEAMHVLLPR
jgi:hypothetical protein